MSIKRVFLITVGFISLALGIVGIFLPVMPTTPFVLLAGFCFSKSSKTFHARLLANPYFGKLIRDWEQHQILSKRTKIISTGMIAISGASIGYFFSDKLWLQLLCLPFLIFAAIFILTRPSTPSPNRNEKRL